jgi:hypothetical protein
MSPMRVMKLMVGEWIVESWRLWRATGFAVLWAILGLGLMGGLPVAAQEPDALTETNDVMAVEVLARVSELIQSADPAQLEEMAALRDLIPTNSLLQFNGAAPGDSGPDKVVRPDSSGHSEHTNRFQSSNRSQNDDRRSRSRRSSRSRSDQAGGSNSARDYGRSSDLLQTNAPVGDSSGPAKPDYSAFKVIVDRNIFDPNRFPRRAGESIVRRPPKTVDSLTLVGTMSYDKGTFAFFDGTSAEYKKALKLTDAIAGYKLTNIAPDRVRLASGTNELELHVGMQLRREEEGPWLLASQSTTYAAPPASTSTNTAAAASAPATAAVTGSDAVAGGSESDIIKKLMQRREKE